MNNLSETQKAYIAGFIDGEGCISVYRVSRKWREHGNYYPLVRVTNTNKEILDTLQRWTGLGLVRPQSIRKRNKDFMRNCKEQWKWAISPNPMRELLPVIIPYLQVKKKIAQLVMELLGDKVRPRGRNVTQLELDRCERLTVEIQKLNTRDIGARPPYRRKNGS